MVPSPQSATHASTLQTLMPLLLTLTGGGISLVSSFLVGWRLHVLNRRATREEKRKEKLERFAALVREIYRVPFQMPQVAAEDARLNWLSLTEEMSDISLMYLPELMPAAARITDASQALMKSAELVIEGSVTNNDAERAGRAFMRKQKAMSQAWEAAMDDIRERAERFRMYEAFQPLAKQVADQKEASDIDK